MMSNQEIIRRRQYCQIVKETKIHRLIFNQGIFRLSENFLRKNRACGDHFFLKYLKRTESVLRKQILDVPFPAECSVPKN
jgi:hypothetical protein